MHGLTLALLTLTLSVDRVNDDDMQPEQGRDAQVKLDFGKLDDDVVTLPSRRMIFPVSVDPMVKDQVDSVKMFVSVDKGKTWTLQATCKPTDNKVPFSAPRDGLYYFTLQVVYKSGKSDPATVEKFEVQQKVFVNSEQKVLKPR